MPLRDHFRPPLSVTHPWKGFHSAWANAITSQLNDVLPEGYYAIPEVPLGDQIEIDVATLEEGETSAQSGGGLATAVWAPPQPTLSVAVDFHRLDVFEVQVHREGGLEMVAAVELVSPRNKDRQTARRHFAAKCVAYLQAGVSVIVVDVVTGRRQNLYAALLEQLGLAPGDPGQDELYAVACRPVPPEEPGRLETWITSLAVGSPLPTLPLLLEADLTVPLPLERSYEATFVELRVPV
ncbi:MAG TPA: DUF4058 family protein [Gemmataceae bacterium]|nr:DUF4058 family protein [Gemmataceae bacterium]